jgi:hypothetical protein
MNRKALGLRPSALGLARAHTPKGPRPKVKGLLGGTLVALVTASVMTTFAQARCDRACLIAIADTYIDALVAKDSKKAPLAATVKYTENGQRLLPGDGFWNSVAGKGTYKLQIADPTAGQIVTMITMREAGNPQPQGVILSARLKVVNTRITEIEHLVSHSDAGARNFEARGQPREAFNRPTPPARRKSRAELVRVANMYFSGMQLNDGKGHYPFADDCHRIENGGDSTNAKTSRDGGPRPDPKTATGYSGMWTCREQFESGMLHFVSRIRDRRYVAVDEERGVVASYVFFDHDAGASRTFTTSTGRTMTAGPMQPWTWEIMEVFKVEDGLLHEIEAALERAPYGMTSGWSSWEDGMSDRIQFDK